jgi:exodeoxyribonuclease III
VRIITFNANGIRAAARKGFFQWFVRQRADVLCVQELKAQAYQLDDAYELRGYHRCLFSAEKPGYSGVAIYSRETPIAVTQGFGDAEFDAEGRHLEARFSKLVVASTYFPSGSSSDARQIAKFRFLARFEERMKEMLADPLPHVICGDVNIAHKKIDIKNWRSNQKNSGFTPEERAWMDYVVDGLGFVDVFRTIEPSPDHYTWWSNRGRARENNVGWRIDYQLGTPALAAAGSKARIYKTRFFSDHAPLIIDYDLP